MHPNGKPSSARQHGLMYPLVKQQKNIENHHCCWEKNTISMAMFNGYVKSPEGMSSRFQVNN